MEDFSERIRLELVSRYPTSACCRKALLLGLLINAEYGIDESVYIRLTGKKSGELCQKLLYDVYGREVTPEFENCYGRISSEILVRSARLAALMKTLADPEKMTVRSDIIKCKQCAKFFFAGIMIAAGTLGNPEKESRAEIRVNEPVRAEKLIGLLSEIPLCPSESNRKGVTSLLFRDSDSVEVLLGACGADTAAMELMQYKMVRELRGDINRQRNCEINNMARTAGAVAIQLEAIQRLRQSGKISQLSEDLRITCDLREAYPEATLTELAAYHQPPISKSGLNHRLEKILAASNS